MKTIKDVMIFLNQMEVFVLSGVEYDTFGIIKQILTDEIGGVDLDKLVELLDIVDNLHIEYLKKNFHFDRSLVNTLRDKIFDMYEQKMLKKADNA